MSDFTDTVRCNICGETSPYDDITCNCEKEEDHGPARDED